MRMTRAEEKTCWSTEVELNYIKNIGKSLLTSKCIQKNTPRIDYLRGYLKAANQRIHWGEIDRHACIRFCQQEIGAIIA